MILVFPSDHEFNYNRLRAGITVLLDRSPSKLDQTLRNCMRYTAWKYDDTMTISIISIQEKENGVHVEIPWGDIEPFTETIQHWLGIYP